MALPWKFAQAPSTLPLLRMPQALRNNLPTPRTWSTAWGNGPLGLEILKIPPPKSVALCIDGKSEAVWTRRSRIKHTLSSERIYGYKPTCRLLFLLSSAKSKQTFVPFRAAAQCFMTISAAHRTMTAVLTTTLSIILSLDFLKLLNLLAALLNE